MVKLKTDFEIALIKESSLLLEKALAEVASYIKPGITGLQIDKLVEQVIMDHGGKPSFKNYKGFPYSICFSLNEAVVHGFPTNREVTDGDIFTVDCGVFLNGYHSDSAYTFALGEIQAQTHKLLTVTKECLYKGIEFAKTHQRIGDLAHAIQAHAESNGFTVVRELVGHGIGADLHEAPEVPNYGKRGSGPVLKKNTVIAIEPMINQGKRDIKTLKDGWTIVTRDGLPSAHFEHTVVVKDDAAEVLTSFNTVEKNIKENKNLTYI